MGLPLASAMLACSTGVSGEKSPPAQAFGNTPKPEALPTAPYFDSVPNFCSHEHWGSIGSIGTTSEGFRADTEAGAEPSRPSSICDLVLDPYLGGWIAATGVDINMLSHRAGRPNFSTWWDQQPKQALDAIRPHLERQLSTGTFQCTRRGVQLLYDINIGTLDLNDWIRADEAVKEAYNDMFAWYQSAMNKANFSELIRPVHPEFYFRTPNKSAADVERSFTHTVMRIDPLLDLWTVNCPRRDALAEATRIEPKDPKSWRTFIERLFDIAEKNGAIGIKQLQAYSRNLEFKPRADSDVLWSCELKPNEIIIFQDWVVNECCKQANERGWPHQVHVGTHNLPDSSPLPLEGLARRYPSMKLVMLHCWPYLSEAGWIAKHVPNAFIDTCWMPVLNPTFFRQAVEEWLTYVPTHKIMCAHDSTSVEMAVGSSLFTREMLSQALAEHVGTYMIEAPHLGRLAADMLNNNAVSVYGIGKKVKPVTIY